MNIYKTSKDYKTFNLWAKVLAVFLAIALAVTMTPSGATKAFADQSGISDVIAESEQRANDEGDNTQTQSEQATAVESDSAQAGDSSIDTAQADDSSADTAQNSSSYEQENTAINETDSSTTSTSNTNTVSTNQDTEAVNNALQNRSSDDGSLSSDDIISTLQDASETLSSSAFDIDEIEDILADINILDFVKQLFIPSEDNESEGSGYTSIPEFMSVLTNNNPDYQGDYEKYNNKTNDITDEKNKYSQYTINTNNTFNLPNSRFLECTYSYHLNENQTGVIIDGLAYVSKQDYEISNVQEKKTRERKTLYIPSSITLKKDKNINNADKPKTLPVLGVAEKAFAGQQFFEHIYIAHGNELTAFDYLDIAKNAFSDCISVEKVYVDRNVLLGESSFASCDMLTNITFNRNVAKIQDKVFENCYSLNWVFWGNVYINQFSEAYEKYKVDDSFYTFGSKVFSGCSSLKTICVPESVKFIKDEAFANCAFLEEVVFGNSTEKLGNNLIKFDDAQQSSSLSKVVFLKQETDFGKDVFTFSDKNKSKLTDKSFYIYSSDGSQVMKRCYEYSLPFSSDGDVILDAINKYSQVKEDSGETVVVKGDTREHKTIPYEQGDGTKNLPYKISSFGDLKNFAACVNSGQTDACAILAADIKTNMDSSGNAVNQNNWTSIGIDKPWTGTFDGNNYTIEGISQNLGVSKGTIVGLMVADIGAESVINIGSTVGLAFITANPFAAAGVGMLLSLACMAGGYFLRNKWRFTDKPGGFISKAAGDYSIHNVDFTNININVQNIRLGGVISESSGNGSISSVTVDGNVTQSNSMKNDVAYFGGLVGFNKSGNLDIKECVSNTKVETSAVTTRVGGSLVGGSSGSENFERCNDTNSKVTGIGADTGEFAVDAIFTGLFIVFDWIAAIRISKNIKANKAIGHDKLYDDPSNPVPESEWTVKESVDANSEYIENSLNHHDDPQYNQLGTNNILSETGEHVKNSFNTLEQNAYVSDFINEQNLAINFDYKDWSGSDQPGLLDLVRNKYAAKSQQEYSDACAALEEAVSRLPESQKNIARNLIDNQMPRFYDSARYSSWAQMHNSWQSNCVRFNRTDLQVPNGVDPEKFIWNKVAYEGDPLGYLTQYKKYVSSNYKGFDPAANDMPVLSTLKDEVLTTVNDDAYIDMLKVEHKYAEHIGDLEIQQEPWCHWASKSLTRMSDSRFFDTIPIGYGGPGSNLSYSLRIEANGNVFLRRIDLNAEQKLQEFCLHLPEELAEAKRLMNRDIRATQLIDALEDANLKERLFDELRQMRALRKASFDACDESDLWSYFAREYRSLVRSGDDSLPLTDLLFTINSRTMSRHKNDLRNLLYSSAVYQALNNTMDMGGLTMLKYMKVRCVRSVVYPFRNLVRYGIIDLINHRNANNKNDSNIGNCEVTSTLYSSSDNLEIPYTNQYKQVTSTNSNSDNGSSEEKIIDMLKGIPLGAVDGGVAGEGLRRSSILCASDAKTYYQNVSTQTEILADKHYYNGLTQNSGFGTMKGVGCGFIGETTGSGRHTFTECVSSASVLGGETAAGFIGELNSSGRVIFDKCNVLNESSITAVDSGKAISDAHKPATGSYIGKQFGSAEVSIIGCYDGGTVSGRGDNSAGGVIGAHYNGTIDINASALSGVSYSHGEGHAGGIIGKTTRPNAVKISNSYFDGLAMAKDAKNSGCIVGSSAAGITMDNVWYYANSDILAGDEFAKTIAPNYGNDCNSANGCTCMTDTKMLQSGELCVKLNDNIHEGVFGQNLGLVPYLSKEKAANGEEKEVVKWKSVSKSERPIPFAGMPVYKYPEKTIYSPLEANKATEVNDDNLAEGNDISSDKDNNTSGSLDKSEIQDDLLKDNENISQKYINVPDTDLLKDKLKFIDIECDEHAACKPNGRIFVDNSSNYKLQFLTIGSYAVKKVMLDNIDITGQIKFNESTGAYEYMINNIKSNHKITITTDHKNFESKPEYKDGYYLIKNINELSWYKTNYPDLIKQSQKANAKLMENIDLVNWREMTGNDWTGLGSETCPYISEFHGQGFTISNLTNQSFFGVAKNANLHDLTFNNVSKTLAALADSCSGTNIIKGIKVNNASQLQSGLVQKVTGTISFESCFVSNTSLMAKGENARCGGLIGVSDNGGGNKVDIRKCSVDVKIESNYLWCRLGGVIGELVHHNNNTNVNIDQSKINVNATYSGIKAPGTTENNAAYIGGLIGEAMYIEGWEKWKYRYEKCNVTNCIIGGSLVNKNAAFCYGFGYGLAANGQNNILNFSQLSTGNTSTNCACYFEHVNNLSKTYINQSSNFPDITYRHSGGTAIEDPIHKDGDTKPYEKLTDNGFGSDCWLENPNSAIPSHLTSGEATYELSKSCNLFVQKLDDSSLSVSEFPDLYLDYKPEGPEYIIRFDGNGAINSNEKMSSVFCKQGETVKLPKNSYKKTGEGFVGWATNPNGKAVYKDEADFKVSKSTFNKDIKLYAVWLPVNQLNTQENLVETDGSDFNEADNNENSEYEGSDSTDQNADKVLPGTVYQYNRQSVTATYYSNLTDDNSYIVRPTAANETYSMYEMRVKSKCPCTVPIVAKDGYKITDVKYNLKYNTSDGQPNEPEGQRKEIYGALTINGNSSIAYFENIYDHGVLLIDVKTEVIGGIKPAGEGTDASPFLVNTREEMLYIAQIVNNGTAENINNGYMNVKICSNINLEGSGFPGIGASNHPFNGVIHGEYKTPTNEDKCFCISGINSTLVNYAQNAHIKNLSCIGSSAKNSIVAYNANNSIIENISTSGSVGTSDGSRICGAIVAHMQNCTRVISCMNSAEVQSSIKAADNPWIGGIAGQVDSGCKVEKCDNYGQVLANRKNTYLGGIVGRTDNDSTSATNLEKCTNEGSLKQGDNVGDCNAGGLVGAITRTGGKMNVDDPHKLVFTNCVNNSDINSKFSAAGGFVGYVENVTDSGGDYPADIVIDKSSNLGDIDCVQYAGGFVGLIRGLHFLTLTGSVSSARQFDASSTGTIVGYYASIEGFWLDFSNTDTYLCKAANVGLCGEGSEFTLWQGKPQIKDAQEFIHGNLCAEMNSKFNNQFCQCIDRLDCLADKGPRSITDDSQREKFSLHYIEKKFIDGREEKFYSNYKSDELCWINLASSKNVEYTATSSHYPVGAEMNVGVVSKRGTLLDTVTTNETKTNKSVYSLKFSHDTNSANFTYKFTNAGDYEFKTTLKLPTSKEPVKENDWYVIKEPKELLWVSHKVNHLEEEVNLSNSNGNSFDEEATYNDDWNKIKFCLGADINMKDVLFAPIGFNPRATHDWRVFCGEFKNSHNTDTRYTISNLDTTKCGLPGGLFGYTENAKIDGCVLENVKAIGGALIYDCSSSENNESVVSDVYVCGSNSSVTPYVDRFNENSTTYASVGGIIAQTTGPKNTIKKCINDISVKADTKADYNLCGGIVGCTFLSGMTSVIQCANKQQIRANTYEPTKDNHVSAAGGIVGGAVSTRIQKFWNEIWIDKCINEAGVLGTDSAAGGILGSCLWRINGDASQEPSTCRIHDCEVYHIVGTLDGYVAYAGGVLGRVYYDNNGINKNNKDIWKVYLNGISMHSSVAAFSKNLANYTGGLIGCTESYEELYIGDSYIDSKEVKSWNPSGNDGLVIGTNCIDKKVGVKNWCKIENVYIHSEIIDKGKVQSDKSKVSAKDVKPTSFKESDMSSGELCFQLNKNSISKDKPFGQNIDLKDFTPDKHPVSAREQDYKNQVYKGLIRKGYYAYTNYPTTSGKCDGDGTDINPYRVYDAANMVWLKNNPDKLKGSYVELWNDIDMSLATAFSSFDEVSPKCFEGNTHYIKGLKCSLFDKCSNGGTFKNIKFVDCSCDDAIVAKYANNINVVDCTFTNCMVNYKECLDKASNKKVAGGIIGSMKVGTIDKCNIDIKINLASARSDNSSIGAVVGCVFDENNNQALAIKNCKFGKNDGATTLDSPAAWVGVVERCGAQFEKCVNYTNVGAEDSLYAAAFVEQSKGSSSVLQFNECENKGSINASNAGGFVAYSSAQSLKMLKCTNSGSVCGSVYAGGFISKAHMAVSSVSAPKCEFDRCINSGAIAALTGSTAAVCAGLIAEIDSQAKASFNAIRCVNQGKIGAQSGVRYAGGLYGWVKDTWSGAPELNMSITTSYNSADITSTECSGGIVGKISACNTINITNTFFTMSNKITTTSTVRGSSGFYIGMFTKYYYTGTVNLNNGFISKDINWMQEIGKGSNCEQKLDKIVRDYEGAFSSGKATYTLNENIKNDDEKFFQVIDDFSGPVKQAEATPSLFSDKAVYYGWTDEQASKPTYTNFKDKIIDRPDGTGEQGNPFIVKSEVQLDWLTKKFNNSQLLDSKGQVMTNPCIRIERDLDMSKISDFKGFGEDSDNVFKGSLNGSSTSSTGTGKIVTISNLSTPLCREADGALFMNINFNNVSFNDVDLSADFGCIARKVNNTTLDNININSGNIDVTTKINVVDEEVSVGGLVGIFSGGSHMSMCKNYASIHVDYRSTIHRGARLSEVSVGGLIGRADASNVDKKSSLIIKNNYFDGSIFASSSAADYDDYYVGGIVGEIYTDSDRSTEITGLYSSGKIEAVNMNAGGLLGKFCWNNAPFLFDGTKTLQSLANEGDVSINNSKQLSPVDEFVAYAGGLIAKVETDSLLKWNNKVEISNSYYKGNIKADGEAKTNVGGLIGGDQDGTDAKIELTNTYSLPVFSGANAAACGKLLGTKVNAQDRLVLSKVAAQDSKECANEIVGGQKRESVKGPSDNFEMFTKDDFKSGKVTAYLNDNNPDGPFSQTLDKHDVYKTSDEMPVILHAEKVYCVEEGGKTKYTNYSPKQLASQNANATDSNTSSDASKEQPQAPVNTKSHIDFSSSYYGSVIVNGIKESRECHGDLSVEKGSKVVVKLKPGDGCVGDVIVINNDIIPAPENNVYEFIATEDDYEINVAFKEDLSFDVVTGTDGKQNYKIKDGKTFVPWTPTAQNPLPTTSGNYYLTADVNLTDTYTVAANVAISLSLDGHMIKQTKPNCSVINVAKGGSLEVYDLNNAKNIEYYFGQNKDAQGKTLGSWILKGSSATMAKPAGIDANMVISGGIITGANGTNACGLSIAEGGNAILHQGTIVGNSSTTMVGGIDNCGNLDNKHCTIQGNFGKLVGGVINHNGATFTNRYYIKDNFGQEYCGGVLTSGTTNIEGLSALDNNFVDEDTNPDPKVYVATPSDIMYNAKYIASYNQSTGEINPSTSINYIGACIVPGDFYVDFYVENAVRDTWFVLTKDFSAHTKNAQSRVNDLQQKHPEITLRLNNAGEVVVYNR